MATKEDKKPPQHYCPVGESYDFGGSAVGFKLTDKRTFVATLNDRLHYCPLFGEIKNEAYEETKVLHELLDSSAYRTSRVSLEAQIQAQLPQLSAGASMKFSYGRARGLETQNTKYAVQITSECTKLKFCLNKHADVIPQAIQEEFMRVGSVIAARDFMERYGYYICAEADYGGYYNYNFLFTEDDRKQYKKASTAFQTKLSANVNHSFGEVFSIVNEITSSHGTGSSSKQQKLTFRVESSGGAPITTGEPQKDYENWKNTLSEQSYEIIGVSIIKIIDVFSADKFQPARQFFVEAYTIEYKNRRKDLDFQRNCILARPNKGCTNIMLLGHRGTGKSSFINSVYNAIHRKIDDYKELAPIMNRGLLATTSVRKFDVLSNIQLIDMPGINLDQSREDFSGDLDFISFALQGKIVEDKEYLEEEGKKYKIKRFKKEPKEVNVKLKPDIVVIVVDYSLNWSEKIEQNLLRVIQKCNDQLPRIPTFMIVNKLDVPSNTQVFEMLARKNPLQLTEKELDVIQDPSIKIIQDKEEVDFIPGWATSRQYETLKGFRTQHFLNRWFTLWCANDRTWNSRKDITVYPLSVLQLFTLNALIMILKESNKW